MKWKAIFIIASLQVIGFCALWPAKSPSSQAAPIELACPASQVPFYPMQTFNPTTGALRQYGCIDSAGKLRFNNFIDTSGSFTIDTNGRPTVSGGQMTAQGFVSTGGPFSVSSGQTYYGSTVGFGNGTSGTGVTTTTLGTGSGPTNSQVVVQYLKVYNGSNVYWIPLMQ
jgi:hypothetical protein